MEALGFALAIMGTIGSVISAFFLYNIARSTKIEGERYYTYKYKHGVDYVVFQGRKIGDYKRASNWDILLAETLFLRPDGTYTVMREVHDIGISRGFTHHLTEEDVRERYPGLASSRGLSRTRRI